jgi:hypothetical protein
MTYREYLQHVRREFEARRLSAGAARLLIEKGRKWRR